MHLSLVQPQVSHLFLLLVVWHPILYTMVLMLVFLSLLCPEYFLVSTLGGSLAPTGVSFDVDQARWEAQGQVQPWLGYRCWSCLGFAYLLISSLLFLLLERTSPIGLVRFRNSIAILFFRSVRTRSLQVFGTKILKTNTTALGG